MKYFDRWIFDEYRSKPASLAVLRILYAFYLLDCTIPMARWVRDVPQAFFNPPLSPAALFTSFPPFYLLQILNVLLGIFGSLLLVGWQTPRVSILVTLIQLLINSVSYAVGKINHDILFVILPLTLAFSGWGETFSLDARLKRPSQRSMGYNFDGSWTVTLFAFLIAFSMFLAGMSKVGARWWDPGILATHSHLVIQSNVMENKTWLGGRLLHFHSTVLWKTLDYLTLILELGFLPAALTRRTFRIFCSAACIFHALVWMTFNILFPTNIIAYAITVPFAELPVPKGIHHLLNRICAVLRTLPVPLLWFLAAGMGVASSQGLIVRVRPHWFQLHTWCVPAGAVVGTLYLIWEIIRPLRKTIGRKNIAFADLPRLFGSSGSSKTVSKIHQGYSQTPRSDFRK